MGKAESEKAKKVRDAAAEKQEKKDLRGLCRGHAETQRRRWRVLLLLPITTVQKSKITTTTMMKKNMTWLNPHQHPHLHHPNRAMTVEMNITMMSSLQQQQQQPPTMIVIIIMITTATEMKSR